MRYPVEGRKALAAQLALSAILAVLGGYLISCQKQESPKSEQVVQKTFASPEDAGVALYHAAKAGDHQALLGIFGPDSKKVLSSGDEVKDQDAMQDFAAAYSEAHRWRAIKAGGEMLVTGADNFVFPIPLGKNKAGQWYFDTAAGGDEILARRIGRDELAAMAACATAARAENEYFSRPRNGEKLKQYAQKLVSDDGKQDGLYWEVAAGQPPSPLEGARDFAKALGYTNAGAKPQPFEGYYFRILTKQGDHAKGGARDYIDNGRMTGGFAVLAYPIEYRNSGIMTFIVGKDGVVYQKDLGENTAGAAEAMTAYNPDDSWKPAS